MWALGIILYQLVSSRTHPFESKDDPLEIFENIKNRDPNPL